MSLLRLLIGFLRVLHSLAGQLVPAQVIAFVVMGSGGPVGMCGKFMEFGSSLMGIARHSFILACGLPTITGGDRRTACPTTESSRRARKSRSCKATMPQERVLRGPHRLGLIAGNSCLRRR
jgi:hypothetical protein